MKYKIAKITSDILFYLAIIIGGYGIIKTAMAYMNTPSGVCPFSSYQGYLIFALVLSVLSLLISWINLRFSS